MKSLCVVCVQAMGWIKGRDMPDRVNGPGAMSDTVSSSWKLCEKSMYVAVLDNQMIFLFLFLF